jgi:hypothetical protein
MLQTTSMNIILSPLGLSYRFLMYEETHFVIEDSKEDDPRDK